MKEICENCEWWKRLTDNKDIKEKQFYGMCHHYPPNADSDSLPHTREDNFCSKFKEKEKEPEY